MIHNRILLLVLNISFSTRMYSHPLYISDTFKMTKMVSYNCFFLWCLGTINHNKTRVAICNFYKSEIISKLYLLSWWTYFTLRILVPRFIFNHTRFLIWIKLLFWYEAKLIWNFTNEWKTCHMINMNLTTFSS